MTKIGTSTIFKHGIAQTLYFSVPSKVAQDSAFPFKEGDKVLVEVKGERLEVRKA